LAQQSTVAQLAAQIADFRKSDTHAENESGGYKYLVKLQSATGETPVFCLSHAGNYRGDLLRFAQLNRLVGRPYCFYGIQARGANGVSRPHNSIAEMAAAYIAEIRVLRPHGPYYLIGECGAAPIAYETAQQLQARGDYVGLLVLLDAKGSDPKTRRYFWRRYIWYRAVPQLFYSIERVKQSPTLRRIRRNAGIQFPEVCLLAGKKRLRFVLLNSWALGKMIGAQLTRRQDGLEAQRFAKALASYPLYRMARLRYHYRPYTGKIAVIANEEWCKDDPTLGWPRVAHGELQVHRIPGDHDTYITRNIVRVADVLRDCLKNAESA
jgi:thioesterase domain-containing protein